MKELTLRELKEIELEILNAFDAFCKKNKLKYGLAYGTLLGAIRYKGFIPWDDDVDVLMPREDYNRFLKTYKDSDRFHLFAYERDHETLFPFAKLCDMTTVKIEHGFYSGVKLGVDIDIFPLDHFDNDLKKAKREVKKINKYMFYLASSKAKKNISSNILKRFLKGIIIFYCKIRGSKYYVNKIIKSTIKVEQKKSQYMGTKSWCVYGEKNIVPSSAFYEFINVEFEGYQFPAPTGYDTYLTCLYGDYLPEPPKEKQKTHHNFTAYKL